MKTREAGEEEGNGKGNKSNGDGKEEGNQWQGGRAMVFNLLFTWRNLEGYPAQPGLIWKNLEGYPAQPGLIFSSVSHSVCLSVGQ
jgi:hypothetical protein